MMMMNSTTICHLIIILGISGDLSRKKILPSLWSLYNNDLLPQDTYIIGLARSNLNIKKLRAKVHPYVHLSNEKESNKYDRFWSEHIKYHRMLTTINAAEYVGVNQILSQIETSFQSSNRMFYFALPPNIYVDVAKAIHQHALSPSGWTRIVLEKPFGRDLESSDRLSWELGKLFREDQLYRMDHYLGKEMVRNIIPFRFANQIYEPIWNRQHIACVEIIFKESFGTEGRGGYFDRYGIIRDVVQNHLLQVVTLIAMEQPQSLQADRVRDEKVKLLKSIRTVSSDKVVIGQYVRNPDSSCDEQSSRGYLDDRTVQPNSTTETYSLIILDIDNERWRNVPFVIEAGKAMDSNQVEIRVHFKSPSSITLFDDDQKKEENYIRKTNTLVLRIQPNEAIFQRIILMEPGLNRKQQKQQQQNQRLIESRLDLIYSKKFHKVDIPDAYDRLILDIFDSNQMNFVRSDELREAWRIFTPVLYRIDNNKKKIRENKQPPPPPILYNYVFGSSTLSEADELLLRLGIGKEIVFFHG